MSDQSSFVYTLSGWQVSITCPEHIMRSKLLPTDIIYQILQEMNWLDQPSLLRIILQCKNRQFALLGLTVLNQNRILNPDRSYRKMEKQKARAMFLQGESTTTGTGHIEQPMRHPQYRLPTTNISIKPTFLTIYAHSIRSCYRKNYFIDSDLLTNVSTLKIVLKPRSTPYHQPIFGADRQHTNQNKRECYPIKNLKPTKLILEDFTIGLASLDSQGIPLGICERVEELILNCGVIPVSYNWIGGLSEIHFLHKSKTPKEKENWLPNLKKVIIILPKRTIEQEINDLQRPQKKNENMIILAEFLLSIPVKIKIIIVNLGGYSPRPTTPQRALNHPSELAFAVARSINRKEPQLSLPELKVKFKEWCGVERIRFGSMETYLRKGNWYGVFRIDEVQCWIDYLCPTSDLVDPNIAGWLA